VASIISWSDVFVVGIGFDIAGAYLLAKGLLMSDRQVLGLARSYYGASPDQVVARVDDRIAGTVGVAALVVGFLFQLAGYVINSSIASATTSASIMRGIAAVGIAASAIVVVGIAYLTARPPARRKLLIRLGRYDNDRRLQALPYGAMLLAYGRAAEMALPHDGETQADYSKRVWRVHSITEGGPPE